MSYLLLFPKGVSKGTKQFIFILCCLDLVHFVLMKKMYFGFVKVGVAMLIFTSLQSYEYRKELINVYFIKLRNYVSYQWNKILKN